MTDISASIGIQQLLKVEKFAKRRKEIWDFYNKELQDLPLLLPPDVQLNNKHAYHLYTILLDIDKANITRDQLLQKLHEMKIGTGVHYISLHLQDYYKKTFNYQENDFPNSKYISDRTLSIPLSANLTDEDVKDVISALRGCLC
jgi:dTDP-4-amino-4,6-dideoxygalactose transaminase